MRSAYARLFRTRINRPLLTLTPARLLEFFHEAGP